MGPSQWAVSVRLQISDSFHNYCAVYSEARVDAGQDSRISAGFKSWSFCGVGLMTSGK